MKNTSAALAALGALCLSACATNQGTLLFGTSDTLGLSIAGSAGETGAQITLGFREQNVAVEPVYVISPSGEVVPVGAIDRQEAGEEQGASDVYSIFGHFGLTAGATQPQVTLGRFFSTGMAARELARGFACRQAAEGYRAAASETASTHDPAQCMQDPEEETVEETNDG